MQIAFGNAIGFTNANLKNYVNSIKPKAWFKSTDMSAQGYSLEFDGTDDYVEATNVITAYPFTLECWVRLDVTDVGQSLVFLSKTGATTTYYGISTTSLGKVAIRSRNTTDTITIGNTTISANTWYHLAGVFTSDTERTLYLNGVLEVTQTDNVVFSSLDIVVLMGMFRKTTTTSPLNGQLSDVRIWNTARTAQQIADNYNKRLIGNESGLVGYWKLDEGNATSAKDYTSNANAGTINGAVWNNDEPFTGISAQGYSLDFDGTDDYVQANNVITAYPFTMECWVRLDVTNATSRLFAISNSTVNDIRWNLNFLHSNGKFSIRAQNQAIIDSSNGTTTPSANVWHHVAGVFESATSRTLYVNGVSEATGTQSVTFNNSADNRVEIGRATTDNAFSLNGKLSDVRIWNTARTAQQIADNYQKRLLGNESGLVGYWKLDEGKGTSAKDYTSNANNGTISGAVWNTDKPFTENISDFTGVRVWKDISGNGYDATQTTSANRPTYRTNQINGKPALVFDGVNDILSLTGGALGILRNVAGATVFAVVKYPATLATQNSLFIGVNTSSTNERLALVQANTGFFRVSGRRLDADSFQSASSAVSTTNSFVIHSALVNYQNTLLQQFINGVLDGQKTDFQTAGNTSDTDSSQISIGSKTIDFLNGAIAEIIIFNRALTNGELSLVHQYLKQEYAI